MALFKSEKETDLGEKLAKLKQLVNEAQARWYDRFMSEGQWSEMAVSTHVGRVLDEYFKRLVLTIIEPESFGVPTVRNSELRKLITEKTSELAKAVALKFFNDSHREMIETVGLPEKLRKACEHDYEERYAYTLKLEAAKLAEEHAKEDAQQIFLNILGVPTRIRKEHYDLRATADLPPPETEPEGGES